MYERLRSKIAEFINSEEGKVGVKTSLSLGLVGGGLLLMQTMFPSTAKADFECVDDDDCTGSKVCHFWCTEYMGACTGEWNSECRST